VSRASESHRAAAPRRTRSPHIEAIILAGGLGTRLAARLDGVPKPMAPIAGRPFLAILLARLQQSGCARVLLSVGHLHQTIRHHFGASFHGMTLDYIVEDAPLGTGGALRAALQQAREDSVLVLNGDTFLQLDYAALLAFHAQSGAALTMSITHQENIARYGGVIAKNGRVIGFEEKGRTGPGQINAGVYALNRNLPWPASLPEKFSFESDFLAPQIANIPVAAYPVDGFFLDIGVPEDLDRAQTALAAL
jgi:D-glycero-alpha-D-manno-heptose 1-phosphate guanylyltransferase